MISSLIVRSGNARSFTIPTDAPEADGTLAWNTTTLVIVTLEGGGLRSIGYTYAHKLAAPLATELIEKYVAGKDAFNISQIFMEIRREQRNYGRQGIAATALSAIDAALWDLKAKALGLPLVSLLGQVRISAPVYGSGGFTSYSDEQMRAQLGAWRTQGIPRVKIKVGAYPEDDLRRVRLAREIVGDAELFVDANGAYLRKQALRFAKEFYAEANVSWLEEPVSSDDLHGLHWLRDRVPAAMEIAAGEYGWDTRTLRNMMEAKAVDVLQADASRCGGITGFMEVAALCSAEALPLSAHCAPMLHLHLACSASTLRHIEYFHDHVRIESMLFDGFCAANGGVMTPDLSRPGLGLEFKEKDAERFANV